VYISFEPLELRKIYCNFCQKENETIEHIFWGCENVQNLLGQVNSWVGDKDINQTFLKKTLIFGDVKGIYIRIQNMSTIFQTVFQKYSNVIEILQFFDFGQQSFFQFYINLSNRR
jgi:hypothetical protein